MVFDILTLFPGMFSGPFGESILGRAQREGLLTIRDGDIRDHTDDKHRTVDDAPYGGGAGMVMKPEPIVRAVEHVIQNRRAGGASAGYSVCSAGRSVQSAHRSGTGQRELACPDLRAHEGIDDRARQLVADDVLSIGDFVLTGGEPAAIVLVDAVARLLPGVLGAPESAEEESFGPDGLLEYPQYTRPAEYRGLAVPEVLLSGNHGAIRRWRRKESLKLTLLYRPDLLREDSLTEEDRALLQEVRAELAGECEERPGDCGD